MAHVPTYLAIDIKSFYASVECLERGLDPLDTNLVVADASRTEKTICLAVSPSLKSYGLPGRARLFEVISKLKQLNHQREPLEGSSFLASNLNKNKHKAIDYIIAKPRMSLYLEYSTRIYSIYLKYFSPEDIHVYSIDEVFIDATHYLDTYELDAFHLVQNIIHDIYKEVGITVTAGIGTNLYLAKVAMDIVAKHKEPDEKGARIAYLNTYAYRKLLWSHTPLTDFWRVGKGISKKLNNIGLYTMGDIARCSLEDEEKAMFLEELGIDESGLDKLIKASYSLLGLATYFTAGVQEVRAWTYKKGMLAPECAGIIHSDFERGFIRAETVSYDDLVEYGSMPKAKEAGRVRLEGKEYEVKDGDIMLFRFNV